MKTHCITVKAPNGKLFSLDVDQVTAMQMEIAGAEVMPILATGELDELCDALIALEDGEETLN